MLTALASNIPDHRDQTELLLNGKLAIFFWPEVVLGGILPFILVINRRTRENNQWLGLAALLAVVGIMLKRLNIMMASMSLPLIQFAPGQPQGEPVDQAKRSSSPWATTRRRWSSGPCPWASLPSAPCSLPLVSVTSAAGHTSLQPCHRRRSPSASREPDMPEAGARLTLYTALAGLLSPPSEEMLRAAASREFAEALHAGFRLCRVTARPGSRSVSTRSRQRHGLARSGSLGGVRPPLPRPGTAHRAAVGVRVDHRGDGGAGLVPVRVVESVSAAYTDGGFRLEPGSEPADYLGGSSSTSSSLRRPGRTIGGPARSLYRRALRRLGPAAGGGGGT